MTEPNAEVIPTNGAVEQPAAPAQVVVDENDRLRAELLSVKHMNITNQITILQMQVAGLQRDQQSLFDRITSDRAALEEKYNINLQTHQVLADTGLVVPRPGAHPGLAGMLPR